MLLKEYRKLPWPRNFWSTVLHKEVSEKEVPEDWELALKYVFETRLDAKKADILRHYFQCGMTFQEIGDLYGLTLETVRQHASKAIRAMRHPSWRAFLVYGLEEGKAVLAEARTAAEHQRLDGRTVVSAACRIETLDLSVRTFNCLKRAGINTVEQLSQCGDEDLARLHNMGTKSLREIKDRLAIIRGEGLEKTDGKQGVADGLISQEILMEVIENIDWYSVNEEGLLHKGAQKAECAFVRYADIETAIKAAVAQSKQKEHGQWKRVGQVSVDGEYVDIYRCGKCSIPHDKKSRYCPSCGAKMEACK